MDVSPWSDPAFRPLFPLIIFTLLHHPNIIRIAGYAIVLSLAGLLLAPSIVRSIYFYGYCNAWIELYVSVGGLLFPIAACVGAFTQAVCGDIQTPHKIHEPHLLCE